MVEIIKRLWLGIFLIAVVSGILLASDKQSRRHSPVPPEKKIKVAVVKTCSGSLLDDAERGMIEGLADRGYRNHETIELRRFSPEQDAATASMIAKQVTDGTYRLVLTASTLSLQSIAAANLQGKTVHVFSAVTDPAGAGVGIKMNSLEKPPYLTGVGTFQPVARIFETAKSFYPALKRVGAFYNPAEANSEACLRKARAASNKLGIELTEATISQGSDVSEAAAALVGQNVEAFWVGCDVNVNTAIDLVCQAANSARIPVFSNVGGHVEHGSLFDLGANYLDVGRAAGKIAADILDGTDPARIPVSDLMPERIMLNKRALGRLKDPWTFSAEALAKAARIIEPDGASVAAPPDNAAPPAHVNDSARAKPGRNYRLGFAYFAPETSQQAAFDGLFDGLRELGYEEGKNLTVERQHAQGEMNNIPAILQTLDASSVDAIVTFTTPVLISAGAIVKQKPVVFTYVTDPLSAGVGESWTHHLPHLTGVGSFPALAETLDFIAAALPRFNSLGVIYNSGESNSVKVIEELRRIMAARGLRLYEQTASATSEVAQAMQALVSERPDAIYIPGDNVAYQAYEVIAKTAMDARIPLIPDMPEYADQEAFAGVGVGFYESAKATGEYVGWVLNGESPANIPMRNISVKKIRVNQTVAKRLGINLPPDIIQQYAGPLAQKEKLNRRWRIDIVQLLEAPAIATSRAGFLAGIKEAGLEEGQDFEIRLRDAQGDLPTVNSLLDTAVTEQSDLIATITTPVLQAALSKIKDRPLIYTLALDPLLVGDRGTHEQHQPNAAGVFDRSPFEKMIGILRELLPQATVIGTLYAPAESNSVYFKNELQKAAEHAGYTLIALPTNSPSEASDSALALTQRGVHLICQINDNMHDAVFPTIVGAANRAKIPVFTFSSGLVKEGALLAVANDHYDGGRESGLIAAEVMRGRSPADIPYRGISKTKISINLDAARRAQLAIPQSLLAQADSVINNEGKQ